MQKIATRDLFLFPATLLDLLGSPGFYFFFYIIRMFPVYVLTFEGGNKIV